MTRSDQVKVTFDLPREDSDSLKALSEETGVSQVRLFQNAIREYLQKREEEVREAKKKKGKS